MGVAHQRVISTVCIFVPIVSRLSVTLRVLHEGVNTRRNTHQKVLMSELQVATTSSRSSILCSVGQLYEFTNNFAITPEENIRHPTPGTPHRV